MRPEVSYYRHNWGFHLSDTWTGPMIHDFEWAPFVVPGLSPSEAHPGGSLRGSTMRNGVRVPIADLGSGLRGASRYVLVDFDL